MIALLCLFSAWAGGVHAGIPVRGVPGVGEPTFLTPASGWTAAVDGGWVRVFVGATEAEAADWYTRQLESLGVAPPAYALAGADEAHGDGVTLVAFRDGNVGVMVRADKGAGTVAKRLQAAIVEAGPAAPGLVEPCLVMMECGSAGLGTCVQAPGAAAIRAPGGGAVAREHMPLPRGATEAWVWDDYGRVTVLRVEP